MAGQIPLPPVPLPDPRRAVLSRGTVVWRIHRGARPADEPNPTAQPRPRRGGRFDSLDGSYSYLYLADSVEGAVAETLCRNLPVDRSPRVIPHSGVRGKVLTSLEITSDIIVADLTGTGTAQINAGSWLTHSDPSRYLRTRRWAAAILAADPMLTGLMYRPRHDDNRLAWMLASTRGERLDLRPMPDGLALDGTPGHLVLAPVLAAHNAALA
jgi:hypothetical protein